jgi:hypothetical protein
MNKREAIAKAQQLEKEAADLSDYAHQKMREAVRLRSQYQTWLEAELASASAEVNCWPEGFRRAQHGSCLTE